MAEHTKLYLSALFFVVTGVYLLAMPGSWLIKTFGFLSLGMALLGAIAAFQKSRGKDFKYQRVSRDRKSEWSKPTDRNSKSAVSVTPLSAKGRKQLERAVSVLGSLGIFSPDCPEPDMLQEAVADYGEPVTVESVLHALDEADYYHPDFEKRRYIANLMFLSADTEQTPELIQHQVVEIARLCGETQRSEAPVVKMAENFLTSITFVLQNDAIRIDYEGFAKNLSLTPFIEIAKRFQVLGTGRRLACIWSDQGLFVSTIADGKLDDLNKALGKGLTANFTFGWLDEEQPLDAETITAIKS